MQCSKSAWSNKACNFIGAKKIINADSFGKPQYKYKHLIDYINTKNILIEELKKLQLVKILC